MNLISHNIRIVSFLILSLLFITCTGDSDPDFDVVQFDRTAADVREDFNNLEFNVGINDITLESNLEGIFWNFRVIVPEGASASNKMPLVMRLHGGANADSPNAHKSTNCLVVPGFDELDAYIISPNSNASLWYDEVNIIQVIALMDLSQGKLHIDQTKTVVMGYSDGGNGSWFFAQYYSSLFSAAIPMATSYSTVNSSGILNPIPIPLYVIHGSDDELFPLEVTESLIEESLSVGSDIEFKVADGLGHFQACDYLSYLQEAVVWLETEVWD